MAEPGTRQPHEDDRVDERATDTMPQHEIDPTTPPPPQPLGPCQGPTVRAWPDQFVAFQRRISSTEDAAEAGLGVPLGCWQTKAALRVSVLAEFLQRWTLREVVIGDYVATLTLAPGEVQTIEVRQTRRTLLEESREVASTVEEAREQVGSDKESINVANTSARSSNWSVSGTGGFSINGLGASGSATSSGTVSDSTATTLDEIHETTLKSSRKVATQSKIQVRGVTEASVETRQTRILRNPFQDRALSLNLFEIGKRFDVRSEQDLLRPLITVHLNALDLSDPVVARGFIAANAPFLAEALLDDELKAALPSIVGAIRQFSDRQARQQEAETQLEKALDNIEAYLFENRPGWQPYHHANYKEDIVADVLDGKDVGALVDASSPGGEKPASVDAEQVHANAMQMFFLLHTVWTMRQDAVSGAKFAEHRYELFTELAKVVDELWNKGLDDTQRKQLLDRESKTEIFRRIPGFLFLAKSLPDRTELPRPDDGDVASLTEALQQHLRCHEHYYTEQYLRYLWERLGRTFVIRLVNTLLSVVYYGPPTSPGLPVVDSSQPFRNLYRVEEVQRDGLCILIPIRAGAIPGLQTGPAPAAKKFAMALKAIVEAITNATKPAAKVTQTLVPADGLHLEPVAGACVLPVPSGGGDTRTAPAAGQRA